MNKMLVGRHLLLALALVAAASSVAADTLEIERADPPKSFRFLRGGDPAPIEVAIKYEVNTASGGEIAFAVHDQRDRPLMTQPMPMATVKQGRDSIIFKSMIKSLDSDVKEVIVEVVLMSAIRGARQPARGETWRAKLTYKVK